MVKKSTDLPIGESSKVVIIHFASQSIMTIYDSVAF